MNCNLLLLNVICLSMMLHYGASKSVEFRDIAVSSSDCNRCNVTLYDESLKSSEEVAICNSFFCVNFAPLDFDVRYIDISDCQTKYTTVCLSFYVEEECSHWNDIKCPIGYEGRHIDVKGVRSIDVSFLS